MNNTTQQNDHQMSQHNNPSTSTLWSDFNDAEDQNVFDVIPKNTLAKVCMRIRPGGFDDFSRGWNGGYATQNELTGAVYLNCEFVVLEGPYAKRKVWSLIGLHSPKGPEWTNMGRTFIKGALNSAFGLHPNNNAAQAMQARCITGFADLDGIEFVIKVDVEKDNRGDDRNTIRTVITPDSSEYGAVMGALSAAPQQQAVTQQSHGVSTPQQPAAATPPTGRPSWAQ